jgi:uncharacterized protein (TIGR02266 family)
LERGQTLSVRSDTGQFRARIPTPIGRPALPCTSPPPLFVRPRRTTRYDAMLEVAFRSDAEFVREHATNLSRGGIFVRTELRPPLESEVLLTIKLPNGDVLHSPARVVHVQDDPKCGGVGLAFTGTDYAFEAALRAYLLGLGKH